MQSTDTSQFLWLALLCSPPLLIALLFAFRMRIPAETRPIREGNPLYRPDSLPVPREPVLRPLIHLTRVMTGAELRPFIIGLRHMPVGSTAHILRRYQHSSDPELQLYAQSVLQEQQEKLQLEFSRLLQHGDAQSPAILASCIEAGLALIESPLTPEPERAAILRKLLPKAQAMRHSGTRHPRGVFAAARFCLITRRIDQADELRALLPKGSPLHDSLTALCRHHAPILLPPPPLTSGYVIQ
jgi:hypothetical protein